MSHDIRAAPPTAQDFARDLVAYFGALHARSHAERTANQARVEALFAWAALIATSLAMLAVALSEADLATVIAMAVCACGTAAVGAIQEHRRSCALMDIEALDVRIAALRAQLDKATAETAEGDGP